MKPIISELPVSALPVLDSLDARLNAYREDLADERLRGKVKAQKYIKPKTGRVCVPVANIKASADQSGDTQHQLLFGEDVEIFAEENSTRWVQSLSDGFVGYVSTENIVETKTENARIDQPTHIICVARSFCYPKAELHNPPLFTLSMGARVTIVNHETCRGTQYAILENGSAIIEKHLRKINEHALDYLQICQLMLHTAYLWGGASGFGIDCSSLIQLSHRMCGKMVLRDSDMQAATIGQEIEAGKNLLNLKRGDLIFWRGHVAAHMGNINNVPHIIHASGHTMSVAIEPLQEAIDRIDYLYEKPIGYRRP